MAAINENREHKHVDRTEAPEGFFAVAYVEEQLRTNKCHSCQYRSTCQGETRRPPCRPDTRKDACSVVFLCVPAKLPDDKPFTLSMNKYGYDHNDR